MGPVYNHKIAYIIPTRNRPDILIRLLKSIEAQTVYPEQIIIVDGSDQPVESQIRPFLNSRISYMVGGSPPSLSKHKNEALKALKDDITLVGCLDDDLVFEKDAFEAMLSFWQTCTDEVGGAAFNITNRGAVKVTLPAKIFLLNDEKMGKVLKSGRCGAVYSIRENTYTQWLSGGSTVWRREILNKYKYDEWFKGAGYWEDVDHSFNISKKYRLVIVGSARCEHLPPPSEFKRSNAFIKATVVQQYHFVKKHPELSVAVFYWSTLGEVLIRTLMGIRRMQPSNFSIAWAYLSGLWDVATRNFKQVEEKV